MKPDRRHREPFGVSLRRRLWTIPFIFTLFAVTTATLPLLLFVALVVDVVRRVRRRRSFILVRMILVGWLYTGVEVVALAGLLATWVLSGFGHWRGAEERMTYRLQAWWAGLLLLILRGVLSLGLEVEGEEAVTPGPFILMVRHASILDTLLPNALVTRRRGILLRYVMKRELLLDPAIDIAGQRLVNCFLDRRSDDPQREIGLVRRLAEGMEPNEGVLIYPEGTRFTARKRSQVIERLRQSDPGLAARAEGLRNTLPPRPGGALALLEGAPDADVVVMAHVGLDGLATVQHILDGTVVGGRIRVCMWRVPRRQIPEDESGRLEWLFDQWQRVDDWIESHRLS